MLSFSERLSSELAALPGIQHAGFTTHLPLSGQNLENAFEVDGRILRQDPPPLGMPDPVERAEVVRRRIAFEADPIAFAERFRVAESAERARIIAARSIPKYGFEMFNSIRLPISQRTARVSLLREGQPQLRQLFQNGGKHRQVKVTRPSTRLPWN